MDSTTAAAQRAHGAAGADLETSTERRRHHYFCMQGSRMRSVEGREVNLATWRERNARDPLNDRSVEQMVPAVPVSAAQLRRYVPGARLWLTALQLD